MGAEVLPKIPAKEKTIKIPHIMKRNVSAFLIRLASRPFLCICEEKRSSIEDDKQQNDKSTHFVICVRLSNSPCRSPRNFRKGGERTSSEDRFVARLFFLSFTDAPFSSSASWKKKGRSSESTRKMPTIEEEKKRAFFKKKKRENMSTEYKENATELRNRNKYPRSRIPQLYISISFLPVLF